MDRGLQLKSFRSATRHLLNLNEAFSGLRLIRIVSSFQKSMGFGFIQIKSDETFSMQDIIFMLFYRSFDILSFKW